MGRHLHPEVTMHTFPLARHMEYVEAADWKGLGELMLLSARKLVDAGAELLVCPDNTNHLGYDEAVPHVTVPWLHIAEEVATVAAKSACKTVGILGTRFLMEGNIYPDRLAARGIDHAIPPASDREELNRIIFDELVYGTFKPESRQHISGVIGELSKVGCDAVILGCTELPLIMEPQDSPLPTLDSTRILARAALTAAIGNPSDAIHADVR